MLLLLLQNLFLRGICIIVSILYHLKLPLSSRTNNILFKYGLGKTTKKLPSPCVILVLDIYVHACYNVPWLDISDSMICKSGLVAYVDMLVQKCKKKIP